jgi:hypothetical protein
MTSSNDRTSVAQSGCFGNTRVEPKLGIGAKSNILAMH